MAGFCSPVRGNQIVKFFVQGYVDLRLNLSSYFCVCSCLQNMEIAEV